MAFRPDGTVSILDTRWSAPFREAGLLLVVAMVATGLSWILRSDGLPLRADPVVYELELAAPLIGVDEALALYDEGEYFFVDTRPRTDTAFETIPGAFFIGETTFDDDLLEYFDFMTSEDHFILFGNGDLSPISNIAGRMKDRGYPDIFILKGGLGAWSSSGGDISRRTGDES